MSPSQQRLSVFPAFFRVSGRSVVVFGNGDEAYAKARLLRNTDAEIVAYVSAPDADYAGWLAAQGIDTIHSDFSPDQLADQVKGAVMVFAATGDAALDRAIVIAARAEKIPANAVDQPDFCDFYTPALVNRAPVAIAIGTEGAGPVLAQMIRARIDQMLSPSLGVLARLAAEYRDAAERLVPRGVSRRIFWRRFFSADVASAVDANDIATARR
ncbi:bifunctional precorrin-2 dehydrogenase/sirohydrochlorin ferrochelatase, partial [Neorhizobium sp. BETTINA12A]|uniref:precorrin-2 dehydrogenase/sirohydrochlorin ferrochelatase family protein n=1 Tax=Neorhizobium sp. BETTINA12A TaxID=2908924 RepID=UPI001FF62F49